jgi:two-component system invasion response regulator UvrY
MIKILIADDHTIVREGLKQIVAETSDMAVADEASNGHEVLTKALKNDYDVIVLDITMPGIQGLDVLKRIKDQRPRLPVLVLSMHPEEQYALRVIKAGAAGYLTKESASDELIKAIRKVSLGRKYITSSLAEKLAADLERDAEKAPHESLSDREYQVMCMIAEGKTVKHIADELYLSVKTISTYRSRILEKMGMKTNAELTRYALQNRLIS